MTNFIGQNILYFHHCLEIGKRSVLESIVVLLHGGKEYKT